MFFQTPAVARTPERKDHAKELTRSRQTNEYVHLSHNGEKLELIAAGMTAKRE